MQVHIENFAEDFFYLLWIQTSCTLGVRLMVLLDGAKPLTNDVQEDVKNKMKMQDVKGELKSARSVVDAIVYIGLRSC